MAKELYQIEGKYYFIDDNTGEYFEINYDKKGTDPVVYAKLMHAVMANRK
jgi:hypothetical protein